MTGNVTGNYLHDKRTLHFTCIKMQYKLHLIIITKQNNSQESQGGICYFGCFFLKRNVEIHMKQHASGVND